MANNLCKYKSYHGEDCAEWFSNELLLLAVQIHEKCENFIAMTPLTTKQKSNFTQAVNCWICKRPFSNEKNFKVRDHNHLTGKIDEQYIYEN